MLLLPVGAIHYRWRVTRTPYLVRRRISHLRHLRFGATGCGHLSQQGSGLAVLFRTGLSKQQATGRIGDRRRRNAARKIPQAQLSVLDMSGQEEQRTWHANSRGGADLIFPIRLLFVEHVVPMLPDSGCVVGTVLGV